uniref:Secreted protein n=1 Tax=Bursaphelenchus xylophilus TaxID=6326 RepID=A0A1I7RQM9_BURXY
MTYSFDTSETFFLLIMASVRSCSVIAFASSIAGALRFSALKRELYLQHFKGCPARNAGPADGPKAEVSAQPESYVQLYKSASPKVKQMHKSQIICTSTAPLSL